MTLDQLPPRYRIQAERQLGLNPKGHVQPTIPEPTPSAKIAHRTMKKAPAAEEMTKTVKKSRPTLTPDQAASIVKDVKVSDDGNEVRFVLAVNPQAIPTAQQKGVFVGKDGRAHFFTKAKIAKAEKTLVEALKPYAHISSSWGEVPIELGFDFYFSYPSGTPKKNLHKIGPMLQKPDGDNLLKGPADALTQAGFWQDDSLIANYLIRKRRTTQSPCIVIRIKNLLPKFEQLYKDTEEFDSPTLFNTNKTTTTPDETNPLNSLDTTTSQPMSGSCDNFSK